MQRNIFVERIKQVWSITFYERVSFVYCYWSVIFKVFNPVGEAIYTKLNSIIILSANMSLT